MEQDVRNLKTDVVAQARSCAQRCELTHLRLASANRTASLMAATVLASNNRVRHFLP
jgi:hypothetical protein